MIIILTIFTQLPLQLEHLIFSRTIKLFPPKRFGFSIETSCLATSSQSVETKQCCRLYRPNGFVAFANVDITEMMNQQQKDLCFRSTLRKGMFFSNIMTM